MGQRQQVQPTLFESIFVGSGSEANKRAGFYLTVADWVLREEEVSIQVPVKGDLSRWIAELCAKPIEVSPGDAVGTSRTAIQREVLKQSVTIFADPRQEGEKPLAQLMGDIPPADLERLLEALRQGDSSAVNALRTEIAGKLGLQFLKQILPAGVPALPALLSSRTEIAEELAPQLLKQILPAELSCLTRLLSRMRAGRALALCAICYKTHPLSLIARARQGDRRAVLDLVKVDKLFLHDRCTTQVIRDTELRNDRAFLGQLARALAYKPKLGWRRGCQLYLQMLFALGTQLPPLPVLQLRLDPQGTRFGSFEAFEKFVERCRADFEQLHETAQAGSKSPKGADKNPRKG